MQAGVSVPALVVLGDARAIGIYLKLDFLHPKKRTLQYKSTSLTVSERKH